MKCTGCGLPLSPQRTHCPRCGKAAGESEAAAEVPQYAFPSFPEPPALSASVGTPQEQSTAATQAQANNMVGDHAFPHIESQLSPDLPDQQLLPDDDKTFQSIPDASGQSSPQPIQRSASPGELRPFPQPPYTPGKLHARPAIQPSFTLASLCVLSGGLILLFVYIVSLRLPALSTTHQPTPVAVNTLTSQNLNGSQGNSQANSTSTPIPTVKPVPDLPGKVYLDNAQIGSSLNFNTAQLSQVTTNFIVNQKIFVTFKLHPVNSGGAVCLLWYVNQKQFSQFAFAVGAIPQSAYSFAFADGPGPGSVAIYWASSTACTDKVLAQVVNFTVNP